MKFLLLACILPLVLSNPVDKRFLIDTLLGTANILDLNNLKCDVQLMLDVIGSDPTEQACEAECHKLLQEGHTLNFACPLVCHGFQELAHWWHLVPETTDPSVNPCVPHPINGGNGGGPPAY